jgi:hypothetical protein
VFAGLQSEFVQAVEQILAAFATPATPAVALFHCSNHASMTGMSIMIGALSCMSCFEQPACHVQCFGDAATPLVAMICTVSLDGMLQWPGGLVSWNCMMAVATMATPLHNYESIQPGPV